LKIETMLQNTSLLASDQDNQVSHDDALPDPPILNGTEDDTFNPFPPIPIVKEPILYSSPMIPTAAFHQLFDHPDLITNDFAQTTQPTTPVHAVHKTSTKSKKLQVSGDIIPFIRKLWDVINDEEYACVDWNGADFQIDDEKRFLAEVAPVYFSDKIYKTFKQWLADLNVC
jgi:hypothetical protein